MVGGVTSNVDVAGQQLAQRRGKLGPMQLLIRRCCSRLSTGVRLVQVLFGRQASMSGRIGRGDDELKRMRCKFMSRPAICRYRPWVSFVQRTVRP